MNPHQTSLCKEIHGPLSNWYFDLHLDKMIAYGMTQNFWEVLNAYHDLMNLGEKAQQFFKQF